jgi:hypothetical protein
MFYIHFVYFLHLFAYTVMRPIRLPYYHCRINTLGKISTRLGHQGARGITQIYPQGILSARYLGSKTHQQFFKNVGKMK